MLDMTGHIDSVFESCMGTRYAQSGARGSDGKWIADAPTTSTHSITLQPLSDREIVNLGEGADRTQDFRKIYVNDGDLYSLDYQDEWEFDASNLVGIRFTVYMMDNRPWRNYCKIVVSRNDG